jgi:biopolymer transport protein ExbD
MAGGGGGGDGEPEFQIAPMIDVLLVLLIFFVSITSAEVMKVDKGLTLPISPNAKKKDPEMSKHELPINIRWDKDKDKGVLVVDEKIFENPDDLLPILQARAEKDKLFRVIIRGDRNLPAIEVQKVMNLIGQGGVVDIAFAASNK